MLSLLRRLSFAVLILATSLAAQTSTINWTDTHQTIIGYGASDAFGNASTLGLMLNASQATTFFDCTGSNACFSILRTDVPTDGSCASSPSSCNYSLNDVGLATSKGAQIVVSSWQAPASMTVNNTTICTNSPGDNTLASGSFQAYANYLSNFLKYLTNNGYTPLYISPQNEPDVCQGYVSSVWDPYAGGLPTLQSFIQNNLGPTLAANGQGGIGIATPETSSWANYSSFNATSGYVTYAIAHDYGPSQPSNESPLSTGLPVLQTEVTNFPTCDPSISDALTWAQAIHNMMVNTGASGWLYWWLRNISGSAPTDNEGLICTNGSQRLAIWAIGNYSRWCRPGSVRIDTGSGNPQGGIYVFACKMVSNGQYAIVAINTNGSPTSQTFSFSNFPTTTNVTPWVTSSSGGLVAGSPISDSSGFTANLAASSITTFQGTTGSSPGPAANVYIAQAAAGTPGSAANCANAYAYTFFNTGGNWGTGATQIGPGTTVHLCGTISGTGSGNTLQAQGSGSSGNPITILWEPGAKISQPWCNGSWCISTNGQSYLVFNGGVPCGPSTTCSTNDGSGIIEITANGTGLAHQSCNETAFDLGGNNNIFENLVIRNFYVRTNTSDGSPCGGGDTPGFRVENGANNNVVHDNTLHDLITGWHTAGSSNGSAFHDNYMYRYNWGFQEGTTNGVTINGVYAYNNHFGSPANFDDLINNNFHHNGIFLFGTDFSSGPCGTGGVFTNVYLYNNLFDGDPGGLTTGRIYWSVGPGTNTYIYNNLINDTNSNNNDPSNGDFVIADEGCGQPHIWNNTIIGAGQFPNISGDVASIVQGQVDIRNNVTTTVPSLLYLQTGIHGTGDATIVALDYNAYGPSALGTMGVGDAWNYNSHASADTLSAWKTSTGAEANSVWNNSGIGINSNGSLAAGSPAIAAGVNLCHLVSCTGNLAALALDTTAGGTRIPTARPGGTTAWDIGAFVSGATAPAFSVLPSSLTFSPQIVGTTSVAQTLTLTNNGTATGSISSIAMNTGTNFAETNTCGATLAAGSSCTISVTFTPTVTGNQSDQVEFTTTPAVTPIAVSGMGTSPSSIVQTNSTTCAPPASPATSITCTIPATTAGNLNVVGWMSSNTYGTLPITGVTDNAAGGSSLYQTANAASVNTAQNTSAEIWYAASVKAGVTQVTLTFGAPSSGTITDAQVTNANTLDVASVINNGPATTTPAGSFVTTTQSSEFILSILDPFGSTTGVGNGFTLDATTFGNGVAHQITGSTGTYNATWTVASSGQYNNSTAAFYQSAGAPIVQAMPAALTFGSAGLGTTTSPQTVTIKNVGTANLVISSITVSGQFNLGVDSCNLMPSSIAPGASCTISATFSPTTLGNQSGNITIISNAGTTNIPVSGMGVSVAPTVSLSPTSLTFANTRLGASSATQTVALTNSGTATLNITSITTSGQYSNTTTCGATLAMSASCNIVVTFKPTTLGAQSGSVAIVSNASSSPNQIPLTGTGVAPTASLSTNTLAFGSQPITTTSGALSVTVTNNGTATLSVSAVTLTTGTQFAVATDNCISGSPIALGASCTIGLTFTPTTTGAKADTLTLTTNVPSSPTVALSGTGTTQPQPGVGLSTNSVLFPYVLINGTATLPLVVKNTGNANLTFGAGSITVSDTTSGDPANVWSETDNCISGSPIAPNAYCTIEITLSPTTVGSKTGSISIVTNAPSSPNMATMTGTAVTQTSGPSAPNGSIPVGP